jgi:hypothetical protein
MSNAFNPANPRYRRGVELLSCVLCTGIGAHVMMADFGTQEHVFSPLHRYVIPKLDLFFNVTMVCITVWIHSENKDIIPRVFLTAL